MFNGIDAILFDMGGTLRGFRGRNLYDKRRLLKEILDILSSDMPTSRLEELLTKRSKAYSVWARETLIELNEAELWSRWMLPDFPREKVENHAIKFNQLWRNALGTRPVFSETKEVITQLFRSGYKIGLVSNTTSSVEVPKIFKDLKIANIMEVVILSCNVGMKKPDPEILLIATDKMGVDPARCAYIGDRLDRDVEASRKAGFAKVIILRNGLSDSKRQYDDPELQPDKYIKNLSELLTIFPQKKAHNDNICYKSSISTLWAKDNFPAFSDFFIASRRLGFPQIELNHGVNSEMLATVDLDQYNISSVHEPCPADISADLLKNRDWLISSNDENNRKKGVDSIKRSIDLAHKLNATIVVIHCGQVQLDPSIEQRLRKLFDEGKKETAEYQVLKNQYINTRKTMVDGNITSLKHSLEELLEYNVHSAIRLGLENRYHYFDIPTPDEMEELLSLADSDRLGFVLDVGHAQTLEQLGFFPFEEWLQRFGSRIIEVHMHDVQGIHDHYSPGLGDVDFKYLSTYIPENALRVMELNAINTPQQIKTGMEILLKQDCIKN